MTKKRSTRIILWVVFSILALLLIAFVVRLGFSHVCQDHPVELCQYHWIGYEWIFNGP
jgi:hypothetical protein